MKEMDERYIRRCFELAKKGLGTTRTNPLVGSVIVHNNKIIGEGYHHEYGGPHAEVNAIRSVKDKELLRSSTIYINLEPCSHFGKTPPCSSLILSHKIPRVVISNSDPFPSVSGKGIEELRKGGVEVAVGVLAREGEYLNRRFLTYHRERRPYIILKWAETSDGYMDLLRKEGDPVGANWITGEVARTLVHKWRTEESGIMVGTDTVLADDPKLNVRRWSGTDPLRITIDRNNRIPMSANILDGSQDTLLFTSEPEKYSGKVNTILVDHESGISDWMDELYQQKVLSVLVEGGKKMHDLFIREGVWDEARVLVGEKKFGEGLPAPKTGSVAAEQIAFP